MFRILESQAPAKQTATDTINTLSSRLQSATLLEDRRAAIQGLRSFAKIYPASVASGALRPLISCLRNDREDVDTVKVVLEALLMLFSPDESSPEASDEIALWLSDEFTQRQDNITALLDLLDTRDFYSRLYSLQLIFQISSARPERTQECILTAPLGIPRLVSALGDAREPVRNEALLLLIALTPASEELQKLVAFENAFDLLFVLIEKEGSLSHGSEVVEDCLSLLANLLRLNISNQSYFRETGCVKRLAKLLADANHEQESDEPTPQWTLAQRDKNIWGLLVIIQLFLVRGGINTPANQMAFWHSGVMEQVLSTAFSQRFSVNVTSKALATCADLIRGNEPLQERFGDVEVFWGAQPTEGASNGDLANKGLQRINVIEALLKLSLEPATLQLLDARLAACECVKAFFANHAGIRVHVLRRAIDGHLSGQDEIPNILTALLIPPESRGNADPYQTWMASVLMFHLLFENAEAKAIAMGVTEGDAESGEEVITCIQSIVGNLLTGMQRGDDERISVGYLMLLCGWLFEEPDAVNDFLGEGSSIQSLLQEIKHRYVSNTLHQLLTEQMGREQYIDKITRFRESPIVRDFEVLPQTVGGQYEGGLPEIFFDKTFVDFLKDNFGRMIRAIDREPGLEISVITNGVERGVSRELVDSLKAELEERSQAVQKLESDLATLHRRLEQEQLEYRKSRETSAMEMAKIQQINESLQKHHAQELAALEEQHQHAKNELVKQYGEQLRSIDHQLKETSSEYERKSYKAKQHHEAELADLQKKIQSLEAELGRVREQHTGEVADLKATIQALRSSAGKAEEDHAAEVSNLHSTVQKLDSEASQSQKQHAAEVYNLNQSIHSLQSEVKTLKQQSESNLAEHKTTNERLQKELETAKEKAMQDIQAVHDDYTSKCAALEKRAEEAERKIEQSESAERKSTQELQEARGTLKKVQSEVKEKEAAARKSAKSEAEGLRKELEQVKSEAKKAEDAALKSAKSEIEGLRKELEQARSEAKKAEDAALKSAKSEAEGLRKELEKIKSEAKKTEDTTRKSSKSTKSEAEGLRKELEKAKSEVKDKEAARKSTQTEIAKLQKELEKVKLEAKDQAEEARKAKENESAAQKFAQEIDELQKELEKMKSEAKDKEEARKSAQSELEDLLIVFGDLEAKRNEDKKRLKDLGQEVSEAEEDDDDDEEEDEDDEE
ncbi:putative intracellular protein transport protein (UsoA) [Aspergillus bombycis]|uniref:Putative intracellular protein transport protein (UsoA) n=1 Tax=Aspergillus bombycis TaxID=109264 RepID=A0A1F8AA63_9EURO|nr:putative intracellular protein transport protein (UsoA) [Aspergillus bombycis]OGM48597.1 putative intracellular protein transport protein (UsoA) [Aspergillus bombycis]